MYTLKQVAQRDGVSMQTAWFRTPRGRQWWDNYKRSDKYKARRRDYERRYKQQNIGKLRAKWKVAYAIKRGVFSKGVCEVCGTNKVDAHHDDYARPLDVRWLCHEHHMQQTTW